MFAITVYLFIFLHQYLRLIFLNEINIFSFSFLFSFVTLHSKHVYYVHWCYHRVILVSSLVSYFILFLLILIHTQDIKCLLCANGSWSVFPAYSSLLSDIICQLDTPTWISCEQLRFTSKSIFTNPFFSLNSLPPSASQPSQNLKF